MIIVNYTDGGNGTAVNARGIAIETDPTVPAHVKAITTTNISNWNTAHGWGNHAGLYATLTGTTNYLPKITGTRQLGDSQIFDNGTNVGVGTASPSEKLHVAGNLRIDDGNALRFGLGFQYISGNASGNELRFGSNGGQNMLLKDGTLLLNSTNNNGLGVLQVNGNIYINGRLRLHPISAPSSPQNGDMYYDSTTHKFRGYANGSWVDLHE
jgi:hypothetical protein